MATIDEELSDLDKRLRQLKIEYDIFFSGGKKTPPLQMKNSIETTVQRLLEDKRFTFAQKFHFNTLIARYNSLKELWRKKTQEREEKGILRDETELQELIEHNISATPVKKKKNRFVLVTSNPMKQLETVKKFYDFMQAAYTQVGSQAFSSDYERFMTFLQAKTNEIRHKFNCESVEFLAFIDEGKVKFSARVKKS